ncbi:MAG: type II secretion system F family protein [Proteobacteria bacterium]|nr:type II secretion system F family protein [Pseudomonadota bacterium]
MTALRMLAILSGLALLFLLQAVFWWRRSLRQRRADALQEQLRPREFSPALPGQRAEEGGAGWLGRQDWVKRLAPVLAQAGIEASAERFVFRAAAALVGVMLVGSLIGRGPVAGVLLGLMTAIGVGGYVAARRRSRLAALDGQLPQALDLMALSLRAGQTLEGGIRLIGVETADPLGGELRRCYHEYELGRPIEQALVQMGQRLDASRSLSTFVEAVLVLKQTGGNLVEVIDKIGSTLRAQASYEARFRALTAEGRLSGVILAAMPLLVVAGVLLSEGSYFAPLVAREGGRWFLGIAVVLWGLGVFWMSRLLRPRA